MKTRVSIYTLTECEQMMGEDALNVFLQNFSCPINAEVESFLKDKARQSLRLSSSVTYLIWSNEHHELLGYFTLMVKSYSVKSDLLTSTNRRLIERSAEVDERGFFNVAVYLIAQLGKNYTLPKELRISGNDLLAIALDKLEQVKSMIGGKLVLIEREVDRAKLLAFYQANGFKSWTTRRNIKDGILYDQMFATLSSF